MGSSASLMEDDTNTPKTVYDEWDVWIIVYGDDLVPFAIRKDMTNYTEGRGFAHLPYDEDVDEDALNARRCEFREGMPCTTREMDIEEGEALRYTTFYKEQVHPSVESGQPITDDPPPRQYLQEMWRK